MWYNSFSTPLTNIYEWKQRVIFHGNILIRWCSCAPCIFFFKSGHKILSYGHFKIIAQEYTRWGDGIDPKLKL